MEKTVTKCDGGVLTPEEDMSVLSMPQIEATGSLEFEAIFNEYSRFVYRPAYCL